MIMQDPKILSVADTSENEANSFSCFAERLDTADGGMVSELIATKMSTLVILLFPFHSSPRERKRESNVNYLRVGGFSIRPLFESTTRIVLFSLSVTVLRGTNRSLLSSFSNQKKVLKIASPKPLHSLGYQYGAEPRMSSPNLAWHFGIIATTLIFKRTKMGPF